MTKELSRRKFLLRSSTSLSATWLSLHWTAVVAAANHAHEAAKSSAPGKFDFIEHSKVGDVPGSTLTD
jgi:hypothetical protein